MVLGHTGGDGALDVDARQSFQVGNASRMGVLPDAACLHDGRLQSVRAMARAEA